MAQLGWFFAGISIGIFIGVLLTFLGRIEDELRQQRFAEHVETPSRHPLVLVRR